MIKKLHILQALLVTFCIISAFSCNKSSSSTKDLKKDLIISTDPFTNLIIEKLLNNKNIKTLSLVKNTSDFNLYNPTQDDLNNLSKAKLIFSNLFTLNKELNGYIQKLKESNKKVFLINKAFSKGTFIEHKKDLFIPQFWTDPYLYKDVILFIEDKLVNTYPQFEITIRENSKNYNEEINLLIKDFKNSIAKIPAKNRIIIINNNGFNYFGRRFNFEIKEIKSSPIFNLENYVIKNNVKTIFSSINQKTTPVKSLINSLKGKGHIVKFGGALYIDSFGTSKAKLNSYIDIQRHNMKILENGLRY